ncbi:MAG: thioredoxin family protein [Planctomycetota bacterium]|nr:thioredoxin family protein [Planctomycetota bacterium]
MMKRKVGLLAGAFAAAAAVFTVAAVTPATAGDHAEHAEVGKAAPDFTLTDLNGKKHTLSTYTNDGKVVVLEWFNPDCPFVVKHHKNNDTMKKTAAKYADKGVVWLAINSGAEGKQGAGMDRNMSAVSEFDIEYPVMLDMDGKVGRMYGAKTTPHMYVINTEGVLVYAGAIDNDNSASRLGSVNYVAQALDQVLAGETVTEASTRPYGCSVKY